MSARLRPAPHPRLRKLRDTRGLTRQKVAGDLGISERTLVRHEDGTTQLSRPLVLLYAAYYGVEPEELDEL